MWAVTFEERLQQWHALRVTALAQSDQERYLTINNWWFTAPMINKHLQWQTFPNWPDPWQLLDQDRWCGLARSLGIVYTLMMMDESYQHRITMAQCNNDNLVLIDDGKYILNWCPGELLNIHSQHFILSQQVACDKLYSLTK